MDKRFWFLIGVVVLVLLVGGYVFSDSVRLSPGGLSDREVREIEGVREEVRESDLPFVDHRPVYDYLDTKKGDVGKIVSICEEFDGLYCLKYASSVNEDIRKDICDELERRLREDYSNRVPADRLDEFIEGHRIDCEFGVPQLMY